MIQRFSSRLSLIFLAFAAVALSACTTPGLAELTAHLNDRGCATKGSATASAGVTGASLGGNLTWDCQGSRAPQTESPELTTGIVYPPS